MTRKSGQRKVYEKATCPEGLVVSEVESSRGTGGEPSRTIKSWPKDDRPREKLLKHGEHTLSNSELLAILLRMGMG